MDTTTDKFAKYLSQQNNWGRSRFYYRAGISSNHFWKLKRGWKFPSPDTIVRLALATEGDCFPSDVFTYFESVRLSALDETLVTMLREGWVSQAKFAFAVAQYDLDERMQELEEQGYPILVRLNADPSGGKEYSLAE